MVRKKIMQWYPNNALYIHKDKTLKLPPVPFWPKIIIYYDISSSFIDLIPWSLAIHLVRMFQVIFLWGRRGAGAQVCVADGVRDTTIVGSNELLFINIFISSLPH